MTEIDDLRRAMQSAQVSQRGSYLEAGRHTLELHASQVKRTLISGKWKESWILEFKVLASTNPQHEVGSTRSYIENPENAGWDGRFKSALVALIGSDPSSPLTPADNETVADIFAALRYDEFRASKGWPVNFLAGRKVLCEGAAGTSRKGTPVTNKKWAPYSEPTV